RRARRPAAAGPGRDQLQHAAGARGRGQEKPDRSQRGPLRRNGRALSRGRRPARRETAREAVARRRGALEASMRALYLTLEPSLNPDRVANGNQRRAAMLREALSGAGHEIIQQDSQGWTPPTVAKCIRKTRPDVVLLAYWQLAELLPDGHDRTIVVDCIAPRPLEEHFVDPLTTRPLIQRYVQALSRADLLLVGNARQRILLAGWLLAAGEDLRSGVPILEVPLAVDAPQNARQDHGEPLRLVTGGQDWPWRDAAGWLAGLIDAGHGQRVELHHFGKGATDSGAIEHGLASWRQW